MMNKKGQQITLTTLSGIVVIMVVAILIFTISTQIIKDVQDDQLTTLLVSETNETLTANATLTQVDRLGVDNTTEVVHNGTGGGEILTRHTHYELTTLGAFTILPDAAGTTGNVVVNISYNHTDDVFSASFNVSGNGLTSMINLSGQFANVGTIIGAALIIFILITAFAFVGIKGVQLR